MGMTTKLKVDIVFNVLFCALWLMVQDDVVVFVCKMVVFGFLSVWVGVVFSANKYDVFLMHFLIIQNGNVVCSDCLIELLYCEFCLVFMITIYKIDGATLVSLPSCLNSTFIFSSDVDSLTKSLPKRQKLGLTFINVFMIFLIFLDYSHWDNEHPK